MCSYEEGDSSYIVNNYLSGSTDLILNIESLSVETKVIFNSMLMNKETIEGFAVGRYIFVTGSETVIDSI